MNSMYWLETGRVLRYGVQHYAKDRLQDPGTSILQDLQDSGLAKEDLNNVLVVLDFRSEGQCNNIIDKLVKLIHELSRKIPVVVFNAIPDQSRVMSYQWTCLPAWVSTHLEWFDGQLEQLSYEVTTKFLCLVRRPSDSRAKFTSMLYGNVDSLLLSFASMCEPHMVQPWKKYFPHCDLPIYIDGIIDQQQQHRQLDNRFSTCLFNIVVESSSQHDEWSWHSLFVTEKTFKAFGLKQIPIWFAVPGLVQQVRELGFDVFDDIVDHGYDSIHDEGLRMDAVVRQIRMLDENYDIVQCSELRRDIQLRLSENLKHLIALRNQQSPLFNNFIKKLIAN